MTDHRRRPPLLLRPRPSRLLLAYLALSHLLGALVVVALPLSWPQRLGLGALVGISVCWGALTHVWPRAPWAVREALWGEDGWELLLGTGTRVQARLAPSSFVGTRLLVLNFRGPPWRRPSLVLLSDGLDADTLRRLRARLRLGSL